ncbi:DUF397 domain-containing protein [Actinomadura fibrosa]|uniref:DUF397 domain-containing protein n=1 Tax=Actinomadura fibrosa TaxID=111802 RepID=A0ABW2XIB3_9ACTN|nr:DUF397 domain-containing protein [Actinomadura fibrosa]
MGSHVDLSTIQWRKASRSSASGSDCVELAGVFAAVAVRDSKDPDGPMLLIGRAAWRDLAERTRRGELDLS